MKEFGKIAESHPGLKMHIDHLGRHGGGAGGTDDAAWADLGEMLALAKLPNVGVKMSGAPSYSSEPYPYKNIHGYLQQIFDAFGPDRCFWGTDITRMPCSYRQCVTMFTEELPWLQGQGQGAGDGPRGVRMARLEASGARLKPGIGAVRRVSTPMTGPRRRAMMGATILPG